MRGAQRLHLIKYLLISRCEKNVLGGLRDGTWEGGGERVRGGGGGTPPEMSSAPERRDTANRANSGLISSWRYDCFPRHYLRRPGVLPIGNPFSVGGVVCERGPI